MTTTHVSVKHLAERWGCNPQAIYRQVNAGKIPALHIGQVVRIPLDAVEAYEAANTTSGEKRRAS